jgi:hypothetical protein
MCMNRRTLLAAALLASSMSSWGQGVGLWAPGGPLYTGPVVSAPSRQISIPAGRSGISVTAPVSSLPYTILTPTGRYLVSTDPNTGYVSSIIEVSRTRD